MSNPTLNETQRLLWSLITAPEGAAAGLEQLSPAERAMATALIRGDERLSAIERVDIYADMYFYRIRDCFKEDFATVCAVVGDDHFHNLITDYLIAHPPSHFSLRYAGRHIPAFVAAHTLGRRWPHLADLAMLEWSILDAFDAPDATPLDAASLADVAQDRWPDLRFQVTPSLRLLSLNWPVHEVWKQAQGGEPLSELEHRATTLRVWRQDLRVFHRPIGPAEAAALTAMTGGATFAAVCERIAECDESDAAQHVIVLVSEWLADGLLTGFAFGE